MPCIAESKRYLYLSDRLNKKFTPRKSTIKVIKGPLSLSLSLAYLRLNLRRRDMPWSKIILEDARSLAATAHLYKLPIFNRLRFT